MAGKLILGHCDTSDRDVALYNPRDGEPYSPSENFYCRNALISRSNPDNVCCRADNGICCRTFNDMLEQIAKPSESRNKSKK